MHNRIRFEAQLGRCNNLPILLQTFVVLTGTSRTNFLGFLREGIRPLLQTVLNRQVSFTSHIVLGRCIQAGNTKTGIVARTTLVETVAVQLQAARLETVADDIARILRYCFFFPSSEGTRIASESVLDCLNAFTIDARLFFSVFAIETGANTGAWTTSLETVTIEFDAVRARATTTCRWVRLDRTQLQSCGTKNIQHS